MRAIHSLLDRGENVLARDESRRLLEDFRDVPEVPFNCAGFLIDTGVQLKELATVREGVGMYESMTLKTPGRDAVLARGYLALADLEIGEQAGQWNLIENAAFRKGKGILVDLVNGQDLAIPSPVWLAAGHALSKAGREIEAFYAYEQALNIAPDDPLALGAKANSLIHLRPILWLSERSALEEAAQLLRRALDNPSLTRIGVPATRENFQTALNEAVAVLKDMPEDSRPEMGIAPEPGTVPPYLEHFLIYCRRWRLFLTYHLHDERVLPALGDTVHISTMAGEGAEDRFSRLAMLFNQIKEDFATARYLLFRALHPDDLQNSAARMTGYADLQDGSFCWLDNGLLKTMFNLTYNTLDKIGFFANDYFNLGRGPKAVTFKNFWKAPPDGKGKRVQGDSAGACGIHPALRRIPNEAMVGLVDLSWDLSTERFRKLEEIRHAQTHRYLVLLRREATYTQKVPGVVAVHRSVLEREAVRLLRTLKSAIFSLAAVVELEERRNMGAGRHLVRRRQVPVQTRGEEPDRKYWGM